MSTIQSVGSASFAPKPKLPKSSSEIMREKTEKDAIKAKNKDASERNIGDYLAIGIDTANKIADSMPVVYASSNNLNYNA